MNKKTIIVVGYARQTQTAQQIKCLIASGAEVINIDPYGVDGCYRALSWENGRIIWAGYDISPDKVDGVLVCALAPDYPQQNAFMSKEQEALNWGEWFQCFGLQRDRSDTLLGLLLAYEQAGVLMFNPVSKSMTSRRKPYQISLLQSVGCEMPATLVSNDPDEVAAFIRKTGECIIKPAAGGSLTLSANKLLSSGQLSQLSQAPAIIQQRIFGDNLRVMVIGGRVCSAVAVGVSGDSIDFRGENQYQNGAVSYQQVALPKAVQQQCVKAVAALGLRYSGVDIKLTADGRYYFLECNSSPIYLDVEIKMEHPITEALCAALL